MITRNTSINDLNKLKVFMCWKTYRRITIDKCLLSIYIIKLHNFGKSLYWNEQYFFVNKVHFFGLTDKNFTLSFLFLNPILSLDILSASWHPSLLFLLFRYLTHSEPERGQSQDLFLGWPQLWCSSAQRLSPQHCSVAPVWDVARGSPLALGVCWMSMTSPWTTDTLLHLI